MNLCEECGHEVSKHGPDGCVDERTVQIEGSSETMSGPCGCQAWEAVTVEPKPDPLGGQYLIGAVRRVTAWPSPLLHKTKLDVSWEEIG